MDPQPLLDNPFYSEVCYEDVIQPCSNVNDAFKERSAARESIVSSSSEPFIIEPIYDAPEPMIEYKFISKNKIYASNEAERYREVLKRERLELLKSKKNAAVFNNTGNNDNNNNNNNRKQRCYTCRPRRKVSDHIIADTGRNEFHHDLCNRDLVIVTPKRHFSTIEEALPGDLECMLFEISKWCTDWNIDDYSVSFNQGKWQTHSHFHMKIRISNKIITRMRGDHFRLIKLKRAYREKE